MPQKGAHCIFLVQQAMSVKRGCTVFCRMKYHLTVAAAGAHFTNDFLHCNSNSTQILFCSHPSCIKSIATKTLHMARQLLCRSMCKMFKFDSYVVHYDGVKLKPILNYDGKIHSCNGPLDHNCSINICCPTGLSRYISLYNHIHYKVWDEITYPFLNFNGCTVEV